MANIILNLKDNIFELRNITYEDLIKIKGIGLSKAAAILSAIELGNRINMKTNILNNMIFKNTKDIYEYYRNKIGFNKQESFHAVYLDSKNMIIKEKELFKGTLDSSMVHPREIFKEAYNLDSSKIICVHNHPSGNTLPSKEDIYLTKRLEEIGKMMGIKILDHIIIGQNNYYSFFENGDI